MIDRVKVIDDLEEQITWIRDNDFYKFPGWGHTFLAMRDALALLKAQEPRVLTLEDVEEGKPYWLEMRGIASEYAICKLNDNGDSAFLDFAAQFGCKTLESDGFGKTWRCWTSRPTDEVRRATSWN